MVVVREGGREGECSASPTCRAPNFVARTQADGRGVGMKRLGEGFPMFRILPSGGDGDGGDAADFFPYSRVSSQSQSKSDRIPGRLRGTEERGSRQSPPLPPGSRGNAFLESLFFRGSSDWNGPWPLGATAPFPGRTPPPCSRSSEMFGRMKSP